MILIEDKVELLDRIDLIRMILRIKGIQYNVRLSDAHINLLIDLYLKGNSVTTCDEHVITSGKESNYFKSLQTIENAKSYFRKKNILKKNDQGELVISLDFLPPMSEFMVEESILLNIKLFNDK